MSVYTPYAHQPCNVYNDYETKLTMKLRTLYFVKCICRETMAAIRVLRLLSVSFAVWVLLSTALPSLLSLPINDTVPLAALKGKTIDVFIAHPDDEVMFFAPTLVELAKPEHGNSINVVCFSKGDDKGLGEVRIQELVRSLQVLGISYNSPFADDDSSDWFQDGMNITWNAADITKWMRNDKVDLWLTFDEAGVSNHVNHKSLFHAVKATGAPMLALKSWSVPIKYSSVMYTNWELMLKFVRYGLSSCPQLHYFNGLIRDRSENIIIHADLPSLLLGTAAMSNAHRSQMVWFRWGWLAFSRYMNTNELVPYNFDQLL